MKQFHIYLQSELGKLKNPDDASSLLKCADPQALKACGLQTDPTQLHFAFSTQEKVDAFVQALNAEQLQGLTKLCDLWRNNGVFGKLSRHSTWTERSLPVELVDLQQAEPELGYIFERHGFSLKAIVDDQELWTKQPYAGLDLNATVHFHTVLGRLKSGRYKLFDGMHRAILLCRQGCKSLDVCFYEA